MSVFWGIAILFKVLPVLLFGLLFFKKKFKALLYLGLVCVVLLMLSFYVSGFAVWEFYFTSVLPKTSNGEITREFIQMYQSVFMLLKGIFYTDSVLFSTALLFFKLMLIIISYFFTKNETTQIKLFSFWILTSILLSPNGSSSYANILLLFPFIFFIKSGNLDLKKIAIITLFFLIANIPVRQFAALSLPFSFPRLILSLILFLLLIKSSFTYIPWKKTSLLVLPLLLVYFIILRTEEKPQQIETITDDRHTLKYDYTVSNGVLNYFYWDTEGENLQATEIKVSRLDTTNLSLTNNQIFYKGKQLTFDSSNKLKPTIINGNTLVYLSDLKRGIGFYQLRSIPLISD